jgi:hypothetical protein
VSRIAPVAVLVSLLVPAHVSAQSSGNSGIDQYQENLPSADGGRAPTLEQRGKTKASGAPVTPGPAGGTGGNAAISPEAARNLRNSGAAGKATLGAAEATAPVGIPGGGAAASTADPGPGGMGWALPLLLALTLVGLIGFAIWRRRIGGLRGYS